MAKLEILPRCSAQEYNRLVDEFLARYSVKDDKGVYLCIRCKAALQAVHTRVSEHYREFGDGCAGGGETIRVSLPYCANCDERPTIGGCIHV